MSDAAVVLAQAFRLLEREAWLQSGACHPSPQDLNAYRSGELSPDQERRLQWHLALCFRCADRLLDLERFLEPPAGGGREEPLDETASWGDLRERLAKEPRVRRAPPSLPWSMAMAALIPAVAGLLLWNLSLRRELLRPHANVPVESVAMPGTLRDATRLAEIRLPATGLFHLSLVPAQVLDAPDVRLEILDLSGRRIVSVPGLRRSESDTFDLQLSRDHLPNGEYRLLLIGRWEDETERREETALRVADL